MDYDALVTFAQEHFTDGLALVIGSGLSAAEGIPGMSALATHLSNGAGLLTETDATLEYTLVVAGGDTDIKPVPAIELEARIRRAHSLIWAGGRRDIPFPS